MEKNKRGYADGAIQRSNHMKGKIHILRDELGMSYEDYQSFLSGWNVKSSTEMTDAQLREAIFKLEHELAVRKGHAQSDELDHTRKMVMAAIGAWLRWREVACNGTIIKAIACRAAKVNNGQFNSIPGATLMRIYNKFKAMKNSAIEKNETRQAEIKADMPYMIFNEEILRWECDESVKRDLRNKLKNQKAYTS